MPGSAQRNAPGFEEGDFALARLAMRIGIGARDAISINDKLALADIAAKVKVLLVIERHRMPPG